MASIISAITRGAVAFDQNFRASKKQTQLEQQQAEDRAQAKAEHAEDRAHIQGQRKTANAMDKMALEDQQLARSTRSFSNAATAEGYMDDTDPHDDQEFGIVPHLTNAVTAGQKAIDSVTGGPAEDGGGAPVGNAGNTQPVQPGNLRMAKIPSGAGPVTSSIRQPAHAGSGGSGASRGGAGTTDLGGKNTTDSKQVAAVFSDYALPYLRSEANRQREGYRTTKGRMKAQYDAMKGSASFQALDELGKAQEVEKLWLRFQPGIKSAEDRWNQANQHLQQAQARFQIGGALSAMNAMDFSSPEKLANAIDAVRAKFPGADWSAIQGATAVTEHGSVYLKDKSGELWSPALLKMVASGAISYDRALEEMRHIRLARKDLLGKEMESKDKAAGRSLQLRMHQEDLADRRAGRASKNGDDSLKAAYEDYYRSVEQMQAVEKEVGLVKAKSDPRWIKANGEKAMHHSRVDLARAKSVSNDNTRYRIDSSNAGKVTKECFGSVERMLHDLAKNSEAPSEEVLSELRRATILAAENFKNRGGSAAQAFSWLSGANAIVLGKVTDQDSRQKYLSAVGAPIATTTYTNTGEDDQAREQGR